MKIDVPTFTQGIAVAKYRVAQRLRHLEETRDQMAPTTVNTIVEQTSVPSIDHLKGVRGY